MQEAWENSNEDSHLSLEFLKGIDTNEIEEVKAYDGEINAMTFNHIKKSGVFEKKKHQIEVEDNLSLYDTSSSLFGSEIQIPKKSEDGWGKKLGNKYMTQQSQQQRDMFS